jgi:ELWxxDGT repeat protein
MKSKPTLDISARALIEWKRMPLLGLILTAFCTCGFSQAILLKDINTTKETTLNEYKELTDVGSVFYFIVNDNTLWKSTGESSSATVAVKKLNAISSLTRAGNTLYFVADDGTSGPELWKSDGTTAGTILVKDIFAGSTGSYPEKLTNVNGKLFFSAKTRANGRELWVSDGTGAGTRLVKEIQNLGVSSNPSYLTAVGDILYFVAKDPVLGTELWRTDGTASKTVVVKDIKTGSGVSSFPEQLTNVNGQLFFTAIDNTTGRELWKSNGFSYGTVRVKDIRPGSKGSAIENLISVGNTLYFSADDGDSGAELWKSNGTPAGTVLVADMNRGVPGSNNNYLPTPHSMGNFTNINGILYFTAAVGEIDFIWRSDGSATGTVMVQPIATANIGTSKPGIMYPDPSFTYLNGFVYFFNSSGFPSSSLPDQEAWYHLWKTPVDGSTSPQRVKTFYRLPDYPGQNVGYRQELITHNGRLYSAGRISPTAGFSLIRSEGTAATTVSVKDVFVHTKGSHVTDMITVGDIVYMLEGLGQFKTLYRTDGTPAGTYLLKSNVSRIGKAGNTLFMVVADAGSYQLWKSGGTAETTVLIKALNGLGQDLIDVDGILFFHTASNLLWRSDGTSAGTRQVASLFPGLIKLYPSDGRVFIVRDRGATGLDLFKYEGGVLSLVKNIRTAGSTVPPETYPYATLNNIFYFVANDGSTGNELWRSDGSSSGSYRLIDFSYNDNTETGVEPGIDAMQVYKNRLYIGATRNYETGLYYTTGDENLVYVARGRVTHMAVNSYELFFWFEYDGRLSFRAFDGEFTNGWVETAVAFGHPDVDYVIINETLFFASEESTELTRHDTDNQCGARFMTGVTGAYPLEALGNSLVFIGSTPETGDEPYIFRNATSVYPCGAPRVTAAQAEVEAELLSVEVPSAFPNPFSSDFTMTVPGDEDEVMEVQVFSQTGSPIEKLSNIKPNTPYTLGQSWSSGMYILRIRRTSGVSSQKIVKR